MVLKVIDVSAHNGNIIWNRVKGTADAAVLRAGYPRIRNCRHSGDGREVQGKRFGGERAGHSDRCVLALAGSKREGSRRRSGISY